MRINEHCKRRLSLQSWKLRIQFLKSACTFATRTVIKWNITVVSNVRKMIGWYGIFTMILQNLTTILQGWLQNFSMYFMSVLRDFSLLHFSGVIVCFLKDERWLLLEIWIHMFWKYEFIWYVGNMNSYDMDVWIHMILKYEFIWTISHTIHTFVFLLVVDWHVSMFSR